MASLLIVDDDSNARFLVQQTVEAPDGALSVIGEASSGDEAIDRWRELHPDILVLDHLMPGLSGLEVAERVLAEDPGQLIVLFTAHRDEALARRAAELGVRACVRKTDVGRLRPTLLALLEEGVEQEIVLETPQVDLTELPEPRPESRP
jgi:DNA-binding NarL/FixJ family response regulator